ncbi:MAG: 2-hydroxyacyl-CoA dehydratase family protein [Firmicutes bacterium]|nr:2-hydroxyacyl-CoA dehydratase family protein [Bacillota bacterium]
MIILGKERSEELSAIYDGLSDMYEFLLGDPDSRGLIAFAGTAKDYMERVFRAMDEKTPVIVYNTGVSPELFMAFGDDVLALPQEAFPILQSLVGDLNINNKMIDYAVAQGMPTDVCSANKLASGYMIKELFPEITCAVFHSSPCENQLLGPLTIKEVLGRPVFPVDIPYHTGQREIDYVASQLEDEIKFLEEQLGRKFSWERMKSICEETNRMMENILEWNQLRKTLPLPQASKISALMVLVLCAFGGLKEGTHVMSEFGAECKVRAARGEATAPDGEKVRAAWFVNPFWQDFLLYDWMESELGLVVPIDLFGYMASERFIDTSTPESILKTLAVKFMDTVPMVRQLRGAYEPFIDDWLRMVTDYKADCGIFGGHTACKGALGVVGLVKEAFRKADIPLLILDFDFLDNRITSSEDLQTEITRFVNDVVLPRKSK